MNSKNYGSVEVKSTNLNTDILPAINPNNIKTNIINTDSINLKNNENIIILKEIKDKCKLSEFTKDEIEILEDVIDKLYSANNLKVGNVMFTNSKILSKINLINKNNLIQLLDIAKSSNNIKNTTNYLIICLYNNLGNTQYVPKKDNSIFTNKNDRKYPDGFFDRLYANLSSVLDKKNLSREFKKEQ